MIKLSDEPRLEANLIDRMARGFQVAQALNTAIDMNIFTHLKVAKTAEGISKEMKTDPFLTKKFMNVLVSLKLLSKNGDKYINTQLAEAFLTKDSPYYQGDLINLELKDYELWSKVGQALKGEIKPEPIGASKDAFDKRFILAMAQANMRGPLYKVTKAVSNLAEFKTAKKLLDLGGGHGLHAIALAQENPQLKAIIFDLPPVVEVAKEFIFRYEMGDRVGAIGGDYMKDDIGNGYDVVFVSHTFYKPKEVVSPLLNRIYNAMTAKGLVILNHWVLGDDGIASEVATLWDLWLSLLGYRPYIYTSKEAISLLKEAGFSPQDVIDVSSPPDPSILVIGKKEVG